MIRQVLKLKPKINKFSFGGSHDHHDHHVEIKSQQNWISNNNFSDNQVAIFGFNDLHDEQHHEYSDPFPHCRNASFFSFERLVFADPYYHEDSHEALMNTPHGYLTCDDPLDQRNNFERPILEFLILSVFALVVGVALGNQGTFLIPAPNRLYNAVLTAEQLEDEMRTIRKENKELEDKLNQLKSL